MIYPLAMAAAIGEYLGLTAEEITVGAADYVPVGSRMHLIPMDGQRLIIDDCYNANPQAMAEALRMLAKSRYRRKVAVVGDMGELGELTEQAHRDVGTLARELKLDAVVAIGGEDGGTAGRPILRPVVSRYGVRAACAARSFRGRYRCNGESVPRHAL